MRITKIKIYGFGKLYQQSFEIDDSPLVVFKGMNESGKSTLRYFMTYILFGLTKAELIKYQPLVKTIFGGSLTVAVNGEKYVLERTERDTHQLVVTDQHGTICNDFYKHHLPGVSRELFDRVYHFDVFALQQDTNIKPEDIGELLLSISMSGTDAIYHAEKKLKQKIDDLFKKRGTNPVLNQHLSQLEDEKLQLERLASEEEAYQRYLDDRQGLDRELKETYQELSEKKEARETAESLLNAYGLFETYHINKAKIESLNIKAISEEEKKAVDELVEAIEPLETERQSLLHQQAAVKKRKTLLEKEQVSKTDEAALHSYVNQESEIRELLAIKQSKKAELAEVTSRINQQMEILSVDLTVEAIAELKLDYGIEKDLERLDQTHRQLSDNYAEVISELKNLAVTGDTITHQIHELEPLVLSETRERLLEKHLSQTESQRDKPFLNQRLDLAVGLLFVIISSLLYAFEYLSPLVMLSLLVFYGIINRVLAYLSTSNVFAEKKSESIEKDRSTHDFEVLEQHKSAKPKLERLTYEWESFEQNLQQKELALEIIKEKQMRLNEAITDYLTRFPFLKATPIGARAELMAVLKTVQQDHEKLINQSLELKTIDETIEAFLDDSKGWVDNYPTESVTHHLEILRRQWVELVHKKQEEKEVVARLEAISNDLNRVTTEVTPLSQSLDDWFAKKAVHNEQMFTHHYQKTKEKEELLEKQRDIETRLLLRLSDEKVESLLEDFSLNEAVLKTEIQTLKNDTIVLEEMIDQLREKIANLNVSINQLETSSAMRNLKFKYSAHREAFNQQAKQYLVYKLSYDALLKTKIAFQTAYLPIILESASDLFKCMTKGRYQAIQFDDVSQQFVVIDGEKKLAVYVLSQGTLDQLATALRFSVAYALKDQMQLPTLIDDSFVHFDPERKKALINYLSTYTTQIFYFTNEEVSSDYCQLFELT